MGEHEGRRAERASFARLLPLAVVLVTVASFWPILANDFVNWDDPGALVANPALDRPDVAAWAFRTTYMSHYQPVAWLAWWAVRRVLGAGPRAHHTASLALHAANTVLVYVLAVRAASVARAGSSATAVSVAATVAALLFALHPLRVEPVAWATALPYLLAVSGLLVCLLTYLAYVNGAGRGWLALGWLAYVVSLLSRALAPALPLILLGIDLLLGRHRADGGRSRWPGLVVEKLPFLAAAVGAALAEGMARQLAGPEQVAPAARVSEAALAPLLYAWRIVWPRHLAPLARPSLGGLSPGILGSSLAQLLAGLAFVVGVSLGLLALRRRRPEWGLFWCAYLLLLGPALGVSPRALSVLADRYTYAPGVVIGLLGGAFVLRAWGRTRLHTAAAVAMATLVLALYAGATWRQTHVWRDSVTLWTRAVTLQPDNELARERLSAALARPPVAAGQKR